MSEEKQEKCPEFIADSLEDAKLMLLQHLAKQQSDQTISRPKVGFIRYLTGLILPLLFYSVEIFLFFWLRYPLWLLIVLIAITFALSFRFFLILTVLNYQKFAPKSLRCSCRFEPCCSNYMLLAIEKHGTVKGFAKGVRRICRCHYPNGGIDYP